MRSIFFILAATWAVLLWEQANLLDKSRREQRGAKIVYFTGKIWGILQNPTGFWESHLIRGWVLLRNRLKPLTFQGCPEEGSRSGGFRIGDFFGGPLRNNASSGFSGLRAHIDDIICLGHDSGVVLDHYHGMSLLD